MGSTNHTSPQTTPVVAVSATNEVPPSISGRAEKGQTLTAAKGRGGATPATTGGQPTQEGSGEEQWRGQVGLDDLADPLGRGVHVKAVLADRSIVDERIEGPESVGGVAQERCHRTAVIGVDCGHVDVVGVGVGQGLQLGRDGAGKAGDPVAALEGVGGQCEAEAA